MSTYVPKPGDRVTSPVLVGEWIVREPVGAGHWVYVDQVNGTARIPEDPGRLTLVGSSMLPERPEAGDVTVTMPSGHGITVTYLFTLGGDGPDIGAIPRDVREAIVSRCESVARAVGGVGRGAAR